MPIIQKIFFKINFYLYSAITRPIDQLFSRNRRICFAAGAHINPFAISSQMLAF